MKFRTVMTSIFLVVLDDRHPARLHALTSNRKISTPPSITYRPPGFYRGPQDCSLTREKRDWLRSFPLLSHTDHGYKKHWPARLLLSDSRIEMVLSPSEMRRWLVALLFPYRPWALIEDGKIVHRWESIRMALSQDDGKQGLLGAFPYRPDYSSGSICFPILTLLHWWAITYLLFVVVLLVSRVPTQQYIYISYMILAEFMYITCCERVANGNVYCC
jgi:hypothetical protein